MRGECPLAWAGSQGSGAPRILFQTALTINFLRLEVHFSCSLLGLYNETAFRHTFGMEYEQI